MSYAEPFQQDQDPTSKSRPGVGTLNSPNLPNNHPTPSYGVDGSASNPPGTPKLLLLTSNLQFWTAHSSQLGAHRFDLLDKRHQDGLINPLGKKRMKIQELRNNIKVFNTLPTP